MPALSGIASAVYSRPADGDQFAVSLVEGAHKHDARVVMTETASIDIKNPISVRERTQRLFTLVVEQVRRRKSENVALPVPVIIGMPMEFPAPVFAAFVRYAYHELLSGEKEKQLRSQANQTARRMQYSPQEVGPSIIAIQEVLVRFLQQHNLSKFDIEFRASGFHVEDARPGETEEQKLQFDSWADEKLPELQMLLAQAKEGNSAALDQLREQARIYAGRYAAFLINQGLGMQGTRFFCLGLRQEPFISRYQWLDEFDLREVFAQELIHVLVLRYNPAVILPSDGKMPPFTHPIATILADQHDHLTGTTAKENIRVRMDLPTM